MANETNYYLSRLILWDEGNDEAQFPTSPAGKEIDGLIQDTVKEVQKTEKNPNLNGGGQATKKDRGTSDFSGNIECKTMGDIMPFIAKHNFGAYTSKAEATAEAWAGTTAYEKYDPYDTALTVASRIIKHSNNTNMLVCYKAGTSGSTEPDLTNANAGNVITDGTVEWIVRPILYKYTGFSESCITSFGMELRGKSGCGGNIVNWDKQYQQCYLQSFEMMKQNGQIIHKYALPVVCGRAQDSQTDGSFESITAKSGYTSQVMTDNAFRYDDLKVTLGGSEPVDGRNFRMMVNRNVVLEDATQQGIKVSNIPIMEVEGEITFKFTREKYEAAYNNDAAALECLFGKNNGDTFHINFRNVERDRMDPDWSTNEAAYLTIPLTADGDDTNKTFSYSIISALDY